MPATQALTLDEPGAGSSDSRSDTLRAEHPDVRVEGERHGCLHGAARAVRLGNARVSRDRHKRGVVPVLGEPRELDGCTDTVGGELPAVEAQAEPGVFLDEIVVVVKDDRAAHSMILAHHDVEHAAPLLVLVVDELRPKWWRRESSSIFVSSKTTRIWPRTVPREMRRLTS